MIFCFDDRYMMPFHIKCPLCQTKNIMKDIDRHIVLFDDMCVICMKQYREIYFQDCKHCSICLNCLNKKIV